MRRGPPEFLRCANFSDGRMPPRVSFGDRAQPQASSVHRVSCWYAERIARRANHFCRSPHTSQLSQIMKPEDTWLTAQAFWTQRVSDSPSQRDLYLFDYPFATLSGDEREVNRIVCTSMHGVSGLDVLAPVAENATGLLLLESGTQGLAMALEAGAVVGAVGTGSGGDIDRWCQHVSLSGITGRAGRTRWVSVVRNFVRRCVLDRLGLANSKGTHATLLRGKVTWSAPALEGTDGHRLSVLRIEHTCEHDEWLRLCADLGGAPGTLMVSRSSSEASDEELMSVDLEQLWVRTQVARSLRQLCESYPFGGVRALRAILALRDRKLVDVCDVRTEDRRFDKQLREAFRACSAARTRSVQPGSGVIRLGVAPDA